ncbi:kinesin-like protein KIN-7C, mitochondrial [Tanacetum coccineum]
MNGGERWRSVVKVSKIEGMVEWCEVTKATEIETLKKEKMQIAKEKDGLMTSTQKLVDEVSYAKELVAAATNVLRNLAAEVTKLSYQNAKLNVELVAVKETRKSNLCQNYSDFGSRQVSVRKLEDDILVEELQQQLKARYQREASLVCALSKRDNLEGELQKRLDAAKRHEEDLEAEMANMWALVAKLKNSATSEDTLTEGLKVLQTGADKDSTIIRCNEVFEENVLPVLDETRSLDELRLFFSGDNIAGLDITSLEELQNLNVEAITKICHAKVEVMDSLLSTYTTRPSLGKLFGRCFGYWLHS